MTSIINSSRVYAAATNPKKVYESKGLWVPGFMTMKMVYDSYTRVDNSTVVMEGFINLPLRVDYSTVDRKGFINLP